MGTGRLWGMVVGALVVGCGLGGCAYENYRVTIGTYQIEGEALKDWRKVATDGTSITIAPGGMFALKVAEQTQFLVQLEVAIREGTGANFYMRTVSHEFTTDRGERFHYAVDGCTYRTADGTVIPLEYNADTKREIIKILVEADQMEIWVGCDRIYEGSSDIEATEYVVIEALEDSTIEVVGVDVFDIDEV